jgi:hypothetical protein
MAGDSASPPPPPPTLHPGYYECGVGGYCAKNCGNECEQICKAAGIPYFGSPRQCDIRGMYGRRMNANPHEPFTPAYTVVFQVLIA